MPRGRQPEGEQALRNAERQARYRTRHLDPWPPEYATGSIDAVPRRWRDAVMELLALHTDYAERLAALPDNLPDSAMSEALEAIVDLDLTALADIELLRGYGRD